MAQPASEPTPRRTDRRRVDTRLALTLTAERIFAEEGVSNTPLRRITQAAGQRSASASAKRHLVVYLKVQISADHDVVAAVSHVRGFERRLGASRLVIESAGRTGQDSSHDFVR